MSSRILKRRTVLGGAALLVLSPLIGCQKKEEPAAPPQTSQAPAGSAPPPAPPASSANQGNATQGTPGNAAPSPGGKLSKTQAQYQDTPKGDQRCDNCLHFVAESNTCKVVEGQVSPSGWSILWAKKT